MDWRFQQILCTAESAHEVRQQRLMQGEILRTDNGMPSFWRNTLPTAEELAAAKQQFPATSMKEEDVPINAHCPCSNRLYGFPTAFLSIAQHGVCNLCKHFLDGKVSGVETFRLPTLKEALAVDKILPFEGGVIRRELLQCMS